MTSASECGPLGDRLLHRPGHHLVEVAVEVGDDRVMLGIIAKGGGLLRGQFRNVYAGLRDDPALQEFDECLALGGLVVAAAEQGESDQHAGKAKTR